MKQADVSDLLSLVKVIFHVKVLDLTCQMSGHYIWRSVLVKLEQFIFIP